MSKSAGNSHCGQVTPPETAAIEQRAVRAEPVHRVDAASSSVSGRRAVEPPFQALNATASSEEIPATHSDYGSDGTQASKVVVAAATGRRSQSHSADEQVSPATVMAAAVEQQVGLADRLMVPMTAEPEQAALASRTTPTQVRIGQVNVMVETAAKPQAAPTSISRDRNLASRTFLRSL